MKIMSQKIDFVILWVDGNDINWQKKKNFFLSASKVVKFNGNKSSVRYRDYGTLKFVFRSIDVFAPWVHKIYLVTDEQKPEWLDVNNPKVKVIDHKQIIDKQYLPLFNSDAIELNIDKIKGLTNNFVYFNDDTLLNHSVNEEDFFLNNKPRDFRIYSDIVPQIDFDHIPLNNNILINQFIDGKWPKNKNGLFSLKYGKHLFKEIPFLLQARKRGVTGYIEPHGPLSLQKDTFKLARKIWPIHMEENNTHRFRQMDDISMWLLRHLQLEIGNFIPLSPEENTSYSIKQVDEIKLDMISEKSRSICINDEMIPNFDEKATEVIKLLNEKYPNKSSFEK